jgi:uncharacterized iron-regulated protein
LKRGIVDAPEEATEAEIEAGIEAEIESEDKMKWAVLAGAILGLHMLACASTAPKAQGILTPKVKGISSPKIKGIWDGSTGQPADLRSWTHRIHSGDIVIIGENHGLHIHQNQQSEILQVLREQGLKISVGLEFFSYPDQDYVRQYCSGEIEETSFLKLIRWGSLSFDFYRAQANFPLRVDGTRTLAINAPRSLTQKVGKTGLSSLLDAERALLPPQFELGRDQYKQRFLDSMPHELPRDSQENYFAAQSIWDDTMAWKAVDFMQGHQDQVLVIVVGEFHVAYGGGLPNRILARRAMGGSGLGQLWVLSQLNSAEQDWDEMQPQIWPHPEFGQRADLVLVDAEID